MGVCVARLIKLYTLIMDKFLYVQNNFPQKISNEIKSVIPLRENYWRAYLQTPNATTPSKQPRILPDPLSTVVREQKLLTLEAWLYSYQSTCIFFQRDEPPSTVLSYFPYSFDPALLFILPSFLVNRFSNLFFLETNLRGICTKLGHLMAPSRTTPKTTATP